MAQGLDASGKKILYIIGYVYLKKKCTRLAATSAKVYQLLAHGRWFSPDTPAYSTIIKLVAMI
jgi:hypothetical protein